MWKSQRREAVSVYCYSLNDNIWHFYNFRFVLTYYDHVKDFFELDPLLLKLFAGVTPTVEFKALCERVPPSLSMEVLVRRASKHKQSINPEVSKNTFR